MYSLLELSRCEVREETSEGLGLVLWCMAQKAKIKLAEKFSSEENLSRGSLLCQDLCPGTALRVILSSVKNKAAK